VNWVHQDDGQMILSVCMVCAMVVNVVSLANQLIQEPVMALVQPSAPSVVGIPDSNIDEDETGYSTTPAYRAMLAERLEIPDHVIVCIHHAPLPHAYVAIKNSISRITSCRT
jgi:hypothetical protein